MTPVAHHTQQTQTERNLSSEIEEMQLMGL